MRLSGNRVNMWLNRRPGVHRALQLDLQGFDMQGKLARVGMRSKAGVRQAGPVSGLTWMSTSWASV